MTRRERRGLGVIQDMLDEHHVGRDDAEVRAALDWISRQIAKDERQQKRRGRGQ